MRILVLAGAATAALAAAAIGCGGDPAPQELLPDLKQLEPAAVAVTEADGQYRLIFLSAVENVGEAAIVIEGRRGSRAEAAMAVGQIVRLADGSTRSFPIQAELRYVLSETHEHWHLLDFERYELRRAADGGLVTRDRKTGFCLGDRYNASPSKLPNEPSRAVWTRECGRGGRGLLAIREGISPGYGDDYVPSLEGQYLELDGLPAGRYRLIHRVNPTRALREANYSNNSASALLELSWKRGRPTVEVID